MFYTRVWVHIYLIMKSLNIVLLFSVLMETKGDTYYVSKEDITAENFVQGSGECQIAVPELVYSPNGVNVRVNPEIIKEDVWIGYFRARTASEYFGCARVDISKAYYNTTADPGQCLSACGSVGIIGILKRKCFCFEKEDDIEDTLQPHCSFNCGTNGPVCGGYYDGQYYMSLYRTIGYGLKELEYKGFRDKYCMYYEEDKFDWEKCTHDFAFVCETGGGTVWVNNVEDTLKWNKATRHCFNNISRPSTYEHTQKLNVNNKLWTGVVRSNVFYKYADDTSRLIGKNAYLRKDGDNIILRWGDNTHSKKILCIEETKTDPPTTSIKTTVKVTKAPVKPSSTPTSTVKKTTAAFTRKTRTSPVTKLPSMTTTFDLPTTTKTSTTIPSQKKTDGQTNSKLNSNNKTEPPNIGLIVGASVSAVVVIVIVIVVVVMLLRSRGNKEKQPQHQMSAHHSNAYAMSVTGQNQQRTDSQEEYADIDMTTAETGDEPESDYAHDYFILEKTSDNTYGSTKDKRVKMNDKSTSNPYSNLGYEDGPYDTTMTMAGVTQKPNESGFNPYNHLDGNEEESSEYDHIGKGKHANVGGDTTDAENMYNTTNLGFLKNSASNKLGDFEKENPDYDHIGNDNGGNPRHMADEDNTYDKTNLGFLKTSAGASDNIYNMTGENGVDDTYSHINAKKTHQTGLKSSENDYDTFKKCKNMVIIQF